jgi:hypothetical protein
VLNSVLMAHRGDAYAVAQRFWEFSGVFASPVRLGIALYFLFQSVQWNASVLSVLLTLDPECSGGVRFSASASSL